jgi:hypothetical protein
MSCSTGYINILDDFLNPDGTPWTGSITYTLLYATTVSGATVLNARQLVNISDGIDLCLLPGLYDVVYNQSGADYPVTSQWNVPASGGPYTVANVSGGVFPPESPAGFDTQVQFNNNGVFGADSTFTFDDTLKTLSLTGATATTGGNLIGQSVASAVRQTGDMLYVGTTSDGTTQTRAVHAGVIANPTAASSVQNIAVRANVGVQPGNIQNMTTTGNGGGIIGVRSALGLAGSGIVSKSSVVAGLVSVTNQTVTDSAGIRSELTVNAGGTVTAHASFLVGSGSGVGSVGTNYGLLVNSLGIGTTRWAVYAVADPAYFGGGIQSPLTTPASSSATGTAGQIEWDADFIYVCTATNTWKRASLSSF